jgi:hypothetical protein
MNPKVKELINTVKKLINELDDLDLETPSQPNRSSIDPLAFEVSDMVGYSGQEYGGFPEPQIKMEDEF